MGLGVFYEVYMKKLIFSLIATFSLQVMAEFVVPATPYPINDYANVLSQSDKNMVADKIIELKNATGVQLGVLIIDMLDGTSIEEASMKVAESWKLGSKGADDGVLLMLAIKDRKSRLEIGRGLEGILTDADSKRILVGMRPYLKSGNYLDGLVGAIDNASELIVKNKADIMQKPVGESSNFVYYVVFGVLGFICLVIYFMYRKDKQKEQAKIEKDRLERKAISDNYYRNQNRILLEQMHTNTTSPGTPVDPEKLRPYTFAGFGGGIPRLPVKPNKNTNNSKKSRSPNIYVDNSRRDESSSSSSSSSDYSSSSSSYDGGGGGFSGGGSSDSW